ncbi:MAG: AAA family ATPase [Firmicutes bacterium]|nr:AAA family ATPase [Bacillota bacterium]
MNNTTFESLSTYQSHVARILQNSFKYNKLAHAYIFEGPKGTKRFDTAVFFAKALLCSSPDADHNPCGICHNCKRIDHDTHPNVFIVTRDGEQIKKKQMKDLINEFSKASVENGPRVYIIDEAERLNQESANTLLKTMEEPGADIYQIMVTDQINSLLKTIVSRAQVIHFKPIDKDLIQADLLKNKVPTLFAQAIPEYTNNYDEATQISKDQDLLDLITFVKDTFDSFANKSGSAILDFKEKKDTFIKDSTRVDFVLSMMILFQKDVMTYKLRHLDQIIFKDQEDIFKKLSTRMSQKWIEDILDMMLGLKLRLKYNINVQFAFDKLLLTLERGYYYGLSSRTNPI